MRNRFIANKLTVWLVACFVALNLYAYSLQAQVISLNQTMAKGQVLARLSTDETAASAEVKYTISSGNPGNIFALDEATGELSLAQPEKLSLLQGRSIYLQIAKTEQAGSAAETISYTTFQLRNGVLSAEPGLSINSLTVSSDTEAQLSAEVNDNGLETTVSLQFGTSPTFTDIAAADGQNVQVYAANTGATAYTYSFSGLQAGTNYYCRVVAENSAGTVYSTVYSFTTFSVPAVANIQLNNEVNSNASQVSFTVNFTENVSGVDVNDFKLTTSNTVTGTISTVNSISDQSYEVVVSSITGDGNMRLDLVNNNTIASSNGVKLEDDYSWADYYRIDNTAPTISISDPSYPYTQISPISFIITYNDASSGIEEITLTEANVILNTTGTATGTAVVSGSGTSKRTVQITSISGDGTISISLQPGTAIDKAGNLAQYAGASASFIVDNTVPEVTCGDPIVASADPTTCETYVTVPLPTFTDNIGPVTKVRNSKTGNANASSTYPVGTTEVLWTVEDIAGNEGKCTMLVTVEDNTPPVVNCPDDMVVGADIDKCSAVVNYTVTYSDNCSSASIQQTAGLASGAVFPKGDTYNEFKVTDANGNATTCGFTVTVVDDRGPVLSCNSDIQVESESGLNGATVTYNAVTAVDNCSAEGDIAITQTAGLASGAFFPSGSTVNTFKAVDAEGNESVCSFTVTVEDSEAPYLVISEPSADLTTSGPVSYTITYSGATLITLTDLQVTLNKTGTANGMVAVSGTGNVRTVSISNTTGDGSLGISIAAGTAADLVGNLAPAAGPSQTFKVDNSAPQISMQASVDTNEDIATNAVAISISDLVSEASALVVSATSSNSTLIANEDISLSGAGTNRSFTASPATNASGQATITISVQDEAGLVSTQDITVNVIAVADQPIVTTQPASGTEDSPIALSFSAEVTDTDGSEVISRYLVENVPSGAILSAGTEVNGVWTLTPAELGSLTITPAQDFTGTFTLQVRAVSRELSNNSEATSAKEDLVVTVSPVNDAPVFKLDVTELVLQEDFSGDRKVTVIDLTDVDNSLSDISFSLSPASVDFVNISFDATTGEVTFTAIENKNQATPFAFEVTANDGSAENNSYAQSFTLVIEPVNDVPQVEDAVAQWILNEDFTGTETFQLSLKNQPEDEMGESITYSVQPDLSTITLANLSLDAATGLLSATSKPDENGTAVLTIVANDGVQNSELFTLTFKVNPVDDALQLSYDEKIILMEGFTIDEIVPFEIVVPANETHRSFSYTINEATTPEGIETSIKTLSSDGKNGQLTVKMLDEDFYTEHKASVADPKGRDYIITINEAGKDPVEVPFTVVVININDEPVYVGPEPLFFEGTEGESYGTSLHSLFFDADPDDELGFTVTSSIVSYRWVTIDKDNGYYELGSDELPSRCDPEYFTITATDPSNKSAQTSATFTVENVEAEEDKPIIQFAADHIGIYIMNNLPDTVKFTISDPTNSLTDIKVSNKLPEGVLSATLESEEVEEDGIVFTQYILKAQFAFNTYGKIIIPITGKYNELDCGKEVEFEGGILYDIKMHNYYYDIPTLFTPNNDGWNDTWNIVGMKEYDKYTIEVFDRRGRRIWQKDETQPDLEWDGTFNGKALPEGDYFFKIWVNNSQVPDYTGAVTITY